MSQSQECREISIQGPHHARFAMTYKGIQDIHTIGRLYRILSRGKQNCIYASGTTRKCEGQMEVGEARSKETGLESL